MKRFVSLADVEAVLKHYIPLSRAVRGTYSLDTMCTLMKALGNPQDSYRTIHIAGTSGKTSTAYYLAAQLQQSGHSVGLTISPHVRIINERLQINLVPLQEAQYVAEFNIFFDLLKETNTKPTYFEVLVAFAYWEFARQNVDYVVVEAGLGGLLDGTNVISRSDKISVITDIGLDHIQVLGKTLPEIAAQKAGIVLRESDCFVLKQADDVHKVFVTVAAQQHARLHTHVYRPERQVNVLPLYQQRNWLLAAKVYEFLVRRDGLPKLSAQHMSRARRVRIPVRMEVLQQQDHALVLDAAHNPQKMRALVHSLQQLYPQQKFAILLSLLNSKDARVARVLDSLLSVTSYLYITNFTSLQDPRKQSVDPQKIIDACHERGFTHAEVVHDTNQAYFALAKRTEKIHVVTGSFYLLQDVQRIIDQE